MALPVEGETIQIHSYKHNGRIHRVWQETMVLKGTKNIVIGANEKTLVTESDGRTWLTREPSICYFHAEHWFNVICMLREDGVYYYCNMSSPFVYDNNSLKYIDYDLDVKVFPDMSYTLLDEDEYEQHKQEMGYPEVIDKILKRNVAKLISWIQQRRGPFAPDFIEVWTNRYELNREIQSNQDVQLNREIQSNQE
ncbi:DUF402 domain-containing protein [Solibacillus sp. CAU 1738]|uniref:nucleoside tri-diphosphate phosphatase n=1 Tax=Solibacillus sp. CAU 1738 TaxID=3140363 RepID=UPI003261612F